MANEEHDASTISTLKSSLACPVAQVNYRLSSHHRYPTPVHDVLAGYDWVLENLLPKRAIIRAGRSQHAGKVAVCGELIGGGLATALALTECRIGETGIAAAALNKPVVDWVSFGQPDSPKARKRSKASLSKVQKAKDAELGQLGALRAQLFSKPAQYFDPFASPILFFRSAGMDVPIAPSSLPVDDMALLSAFEREEVYQQQETLNGNHASSSTISTPVNEEASNSKRRASRRYPGRSSGLRLPAFHISTGITSPYDAQANELAHVLRQSFIRQSTYEKTGSSDFGRKALLEEEENDLDEDELATLNLRRAEATEKAHLNISDGFELWDTSAAGRAKVTEVAEWLKRNLQ